MEILIQACAQGTVRDNTEFKAAVPFPDDVMVNITRQIVASQCELHFISYHMRLFSSHSHVNQQRISCL